MSETSLKKLEKKYNSALQEIALLRQALHLVNDSLSTLTNPAHAQANPFPRSSGGIKTAAVGQLLKAGIRLLTGGSALREPVAARAVASSIHSHPTKGPALAPPSTSTRGDVRGSISDRLYVLELGRQLFALGAIPKSDVFDEHFYLTANPDVGKALADGQFLSGFEHWLLHGLQEGRAAKINAAGGASISPDGMATAYRSGKKWRLLVRFTNSLRFVG